MKRPYVICHMLTSLDGKVTGSFLQRQEAVDASEIYYEINRSLPHDAFACGRVTMQSSFAGEQLPDLDGYEADLSRQDYVNPDQKALFAVSFDPRGKVNWQSNQIDDAEHDPGYDKADIIEILSEQADPRYASFLKERHISYVYAGEKEIDVNLALIKLKELFGIETLLLEGGSILDGAFYQADGVDELSLVITPCIGDTDDKPLFMKSYDSAYEITDSTIHSHGIIQIRAVRK